MADETIPCIPFPKAETISIPLPFGGEIKSLVDASQGPPNDCALVHSLMLQLSPMLASMTCLVRLLKAAKALLDVLPKDATDLNPTTILTDIVNEVVPALEKLSGCFFLFDLCKVAEMISAILGILISYLRCLVEALESLFHFKAGIDLDAAQGNPVLLASLQCADDNAQSSMVSLSQALEGIQPVLELAGSLMEVAGLEPLDLPPLEASTPSLADLAEGEDPFEPIKNFIAALEQAKATVDAVC